MPRPALVAALAGAVLLPCARTAALGIDTGSPDVELRFDNTLRYNLGLRTDPVNRAIGANPGFTAGEYSVPQGNVSANRLDVLSELDVSWTGRLGARVSGALWYDGAYRSGEVHGDPALAAAGIPLSYADGELSPYARHRYRGPWGELLDAFAFARLDAGGVPLSIKAGRHTATWGESLLQAGAIHGISYSQAPLDLQKASATPGVEAKELFRPLTSVTAQAQLTPTLSVAGQVFLEWQSYVYAEGGTFLAGPDATWNGPDGVYRKIGAAPAAYLLNDGVNRPRSMGDFGLALRWSPDWLAGTVGLYYRRFTDKVAAVLLTDNPGGQGPFSPAINSPSRYRQYYGEDVDLLGVSLARQVLGVSVGAEVSWRHGQPLLGQPLGYAQAPLAPDGTRPLEPVLFPHGAPTLSGNTYQARGDTLHAVLNTVGVFTLGRFMPTASWALELTYARWLDVTRNQDMFYGEGYGVCRSDPALGGAARTWRDGCATRDTLGLGFAFTPTWFRVAPGVDLLAPLAATWTIAGNAPVMLGGNEGSGSYSAGLGADVDNRYRFELRYVDYFGLTRTTGSMVTSFNGQLALLKNRGNVTFTAKATF